MGEKTRQVILDKVMVSPPFPYALRKAPGPSPPGVCSRVVNPHALSHPVKWTGNWFPCSRNLLEVNTDHWQSAEFPYTDDNDAYCDSLHLPQDAAAWEHHRLQTWHTVIPCPARETIFKSYQLHKMHFKCLLSINVLLLPQWISSMMQLLQGSKWPSSWSSVDLLKSLF